MAIPSSGIEIKCTWSSSFFQGVNVWHGITAVSGAPSVTDAQVLVDRLRDFYTGIADQIASGTTITCGATVVAIGQTPKVFVPVTPRVVSGVRTGEPLPAQTCLTLKLRTPDATRRGRGRIYLSNFIEDQNTSGLPTSALISDVNTNAATLLSTPVTAVPALAVLSKIGTGTPAAPNPYMTTLNSAVSSNTWSVLRSRRK